MPRKKREYNGGGGSWLDTYADMITLLLTFFVLLYSMSSVDDQKYNALVESMTENLNPQQIEELLSTPQEISIDGIPDPDKLPLDYLYKTFNSYVKENNLEDSINVNKTDKFVYVSFSDDVTFDGYSSKIKPKGLQILGALAGGLGTVSEHIEDVLIHGHTARVNESPIDSVGRRLSSERANEVLANLERQNVIDPEKFISVGYGPHRPLADNSTSEGRAKNRRVEIYITVKGYTIDSYKLVGDHLNKVETPPTIEETPQIDTP